MENSFTKWFNRQMKVMPKQAKTNLLEQIELTDQQQKIFDMRYRQGKDRQYIADTLFISLSTVRDEIKTIKDKIKETL